LATKPETDARGTERQEQQQQAAIRAEHNSRANVTDRKRQKKGEFEE
jgi:hypothetical protein